MSVRKTWDKEVYAQKAQERLERGEDEAAPGPKAPGGSSSLSLKEEFRPAEGDAAGPAGSDRAFLKHRETNIIEEIEKKVGKVEILKANTVDSARGGGFFCEVCQVTLKDSVSYLGHVNGKQHQRNLGFSMRVERVGVDAVKEKLDGLKRKMEDAKEYSDRLAAQLAEEEGARRRRKEEALARRQEEEELQAEGVDPEMAALMGFGGFGGKKKK